MSISLRLAIEGNIGVGKSTLLKTLPEELKGDWIALPERADEDPEFRKLLNEFYQDPNKRVELQSWITHSRIQECQELSNDRHYIFERSFIGDMIFCHANFIRHERPKGPLLGFYYDAMDAAKRFPLDAIVYLQASPEVCFERINMRGRGSEAEIPLDYVKYLHSCYETHLVGIADSLNIPIIRVDWESFKSPLYVAKMVENFFYDAIYGVPLHNIA